MTNDGRITLGVLMGDANSPHSVNIMQGVLHAAKEADVDILTFLGLHAKHAYREYFNCDDNYDYQKKVVYDYVNMANVDALIILYGELFYFLNEKERDTFLDQFGDTPYIIINERVEKENARYVISDNYSGMHAIMEHLAVGHGYRDFVFLGGPRGNRDADERYMAFLDVMAEQGIDVTEDMVRFGDFTELVDEEVEYLFDHNSRIQAFVCANDTMASAVYKVCNRRRQEILMNTPDAQKWLSRSNCNYEIGRNIEYGGGIAVTGYDNWIYASLLDPPMTSIVQNPYTFGYQAVYEAIKMCRGKCCDNQILSPTLICRDSCGCKEKKRDAFVSLQEDNTLSPETYSKMIADRFKSTILVAEANDSIAEAVYNELFQIIYDDVNRFLGISEEGLTSHYVAEQLRGFVRGSYGEYISVDSLQNIFSEYFSFIFQAMPDTEDQILLSQILLEGMLCFRSHQSISRLMQKKKQEAATSFMSLISRDMADHVEDEMEMLRSAFEKMQALHIGDSYLFLFDQPIRHNEQDEWKTPEQMYLAGYMRVGKEIVTYKREERPIVTVNNGFNSFFELNTDKRYAMTLINLYANDMQQGVLISDIALGDILELNYISVQLGTALKYSEMSREQRRIQKRLEKLVKEVEDKNSMLSFISEVDELTGCLNRRGFIENAVNLKNEYINEKAVILFADLDHLKEINDKFGHGEGDFAIRKMAEIIKKNVYEDALVGRIGGDEIVVMMVCKQREVYGISDKIRKAYAEFNEESDKPYFIECSFGIKQFICNDGLQLQDMINQADELLYEAKKKRKKTVIKKND